MSSVAFEGVPEGDPGERIVANLILSTIAFDSGAEPVARKHLAQAHLLAMNLADQSLVYRPPHPSLFARLTFELDGINETILLPVVGGRLIQPSIVPEGIVPQGQTFAVAVRALDLARIMLSLRPRRIVSILATLETDTPPQRATETVRRILAACTRRELPVEDSFDRAHDFLTIAHSLIGEQNISLTMLALQNSDRALTDANAQTASGSDHASAILRMKQQIAQMLDELKRGMT
jgi:hypothetical protein